jgi:hypothetical protein
MSLDQPNPDQLGDLCGRFSGRVYGLLWITAAAFFAALGRFIGANAASIDAKLSDGTIGPRPFAVIGWVLVGCGVLLGILGLMRLVQSFEIHRGGVRYRSLWGKREMSWRDVDGIFVKKTTYVSKHAGRRFYYRITITSEDGHIVLGSGFLRAVSPIEITQLLKLHSGRAVSEDSDDIRAPAKQRQNLRGLAGEVLKDRPARRKKRSQEPRAVKHAASKTPFDDAYDRLAAGASAPEVEAWLQKQGMPAAAARAMVDKAVAQQLHRDALQQEAEPPDNKDRKLMREVREQLAGGANSEKVERWLRLQGVSEELAAAMVQNARESLL